MKKQIKKEISGSCKVFFIAFFVLTSASISAQDSTWVRTYQFVAYNQYDLRNASENTVALHRALNDGFRKGIKPLMGPKLGNVTYGVFSFATTFMSMIWSHEFGHKLRAAQVGGRFQIHNAALPVPDATMHLPPDITLPNEALTVTGGFEVNFLTVRGLQREFIAQNGIYNEDLALSFAHRLMYPIYASLIVPVDPEEPKVWKDPAGDPVNCALLMFENYSNDQVFVGPDNAVNPDLVKYYQQSSILGSFFSLLDPQFYREVGGAFGRTKTRRPIFLLGDFHTGWTYGTLFNVSPLGYELYMNNYIHFNNNKFTLYLKYGNPYQNQGIGAGWQDIIKESPVRLSAFVDVWDQDIYGAGVSGELSADYRFMDRLGVHLNLGYKTRGYVLGKQTGEGPNIGIGVIYYASY